jgi:hypothetical protein
MFVHRYCLLHCLALNSLIKCRFNVYILKVLCYISSFLSCLLPTASPLPILGIELRASCLLRQVFYHFSQIAIPFSFSMFLRRSHAFVWTRLGPWTLDLHPPTSTSGITGMHHHTWTHIKILVCIFLHSF